jgi:flagellar hook-associated protein 3 FlgL
MRISDSVITNTVSNNVRRSVSRLNGYQRALSSGVRINDASDDPTEATRSLLLRSDIRNNEQYQRNINEGLGFMNFVDSTLDDMVNTLIGVRGTAIQGASDTVNADDRDILARDVNELLEHMISRGQTKFRGRFIFAGTETLENPYTAVRNAEGDVVEVGNTLRRTIGLDDRTTAVGTLLGQTSPPAGTVTIGVSES